MMMVTDPTIKFSGVPQISPQLKNNPRSFNLENVPTAIT